MFKFIDKNQKDNLILIPGWAFDYRIFQNMDLPFNYYLYLDTSITDFENDLKNLLDKNNLTKISILGFSRGAFAACDFASKNAELIDQLILIGIRKKYPGKDLEKIKNLITKNKKAFLYSFYAQCFCQHENDLRHSFKNSLLKDYLQNFSTESLLQGLKYLSNAQIEPASISKINNIKIIHGRLDYIAPINQALNIANSLTNAKLSIFESAGHLPFLQKDFKKRIYE